MIMATNPPEAELQGFLEAAGRSLADAQSQLAGDALGAGVAPQMVMADAEFELKVGVRTLASGKLALQTLAAQDIRQGAVQPEALSTVRVHFVATAPEALSSDEISKPKRTPADVIGSIKGREDIAVLDKILGPLDFRASFVPEAGRWVVVATDPANRLVRELVLPDQIEGG